MSTKLKLAKEELDRLGVFDVHQNNVMMAMTTILGKEVPFTMSMTIANFTMASFVGHFHFKLQLSPDNLIPLNMVGFVLAKSGAKKTSSVTKLERVLKSGLDLIDAGRTRKLEEYAIRNDLPIPKLNPLSNALATEAGMIKRLNDFKKEGIGLPSMFVDEISTELATNLDMVPNIKLVAQLFDEGNMKSKPLKDSENQSDEVNGMGMNALFIGSEYGILESEMILEKFNMEFISKLARRCFFLYPEFPKHETEAETIDGVLEEIEVEENASKHLEEQLNLYSKDVTRRYIKNDVNITFLDEDAKRLYKVYKIYCEEKAEEIVIEQINLERQHRHWKVLKLAGVYSIFNNHTTIKVQDLKEAIYVAEHASGDLERFILKAERNSHEKLLDHYLENQAPLSVHDILKRKWVKKAMDIEDLLRFANSKLGNIGVLKMDKDVIELERFVETEGVVCTYKMVSGTKAERAYKINEGFTSARSDFADMAKIVSHDTAYTNFEFHGGIRGKDNVRGACDYLILDVDDTDISDVECSDYLADYNHIICRTSDKENMYKYRVIIPTDVAVDLDNEQWPHFMTKVGEYLSIDIDILPKAQIFYGYADREPIVYLDGDTFEASDLIKDLHVAKVEIKKLSAEKLSRVWHDRLVLFKWFYDAGQRNDPTPKGNYHQTLWLYTVNAYDLGVDLQTATAVLFDIIDFRPTDPRAGYVDGLLKRMKTYERWKTEENGLSDTSWKEKEY